MAIDIPGRPATDDPDEWLFLPVETSLAAHHNLILDVAEKVVTGVYPRAMFFLPPGSAKSTMLSVVTPTWVMGKWPGSKIILASYGSDLARKHGRRARQIAKSPQYKSLFNASISAESSAADEWAITNGSEYLACGILSGITGNRAHGIIIDDPVKGRQEADSDTVRARTWDVYQEDLRTRLLPGGWEIIIQTRWHMDDLSGRILPDAYDGRTGMIRCKYGRYWYVVCLPAQCERNDDPIGRKIGDYLWPEWFSEDHFAPFKQQRRTWNALFQQRPSAEEGTYFQKAWFHRYDPIQLPGVIHYYGSSDYAVTEEGESKQEPDWTEHGVLGLDHDNDIWVRDWWCGQTEPDKWIKEKARLIKQYKPLCWFGEKGVIERAVRPMDRVILRKEKAFCRQEWIASVKDKATRARAFQAMAASGKVHIPIGPLGDRIIDQLLQFPNGRHDDIVDVLSLFCLALDKAHPAINPVVGQPLRKGMAEARVEHIELVDREGDMERYLLDDKRLEEIYTQTGGERQNYFHDIE